MASLTKEPGSTNLVLCFIYTPPRLWLQLAALQLAVCSHATFNLAASNRPSCCPLECRPPPRASPHTALPPPLPRHIHDRTNTDPNSHQTLRIFICRWKANKVVEMFRVGANGYVSISQEPVIYEALLSRLQMK